MKGALLVCGTHSDAGKSVVTAGICRALARDGVRVAPFKAQNMSLNSAVTPSGAEIARSQITQAAAAGVEPEAAMNPILLKPSGAGRSQLVVLGEAHGIHDAAGYHALKPELAPIVAGALADLRDRFDVVVCEGAGSPAEINLRSADLTNMGLARAARLPVVVVADIDRGGVFASILGTLALLEPEDQELVCGFVINKFRGDPAILAPGIEQIESATGRPVLGVIPHAEDLWLDAEDSLALDAPAPEAPALADTLDVAIVRLRWISNFTDFDALASEPGVRVRFTRSPADIERADLVIVPGTKSTVEDLERLRAAGIDRALRRRADAGAPVLGICGGYQMLGERITDSVEAPRGAVGQAAAVDGLGLLPVTTTFAEDKVVRRVTGRCAWLDDLPASGYEVRHGRVARHGGESVLVSGHGEEGCRAGAVAGLSWHGVMEHDDLRRRLLAWVAQERGRDFIPGGHAFAEVREARLDLLGDLVTEHTDIASIRALIERGAPAGMSVVTTEVRECLPS